MRRRRTEEQKKRRALIANRKYRAAHKNDPEYIQKRKEYSHNWYLAHKEEKKAASKKWAEENKDRHLEHEKKYVKKHILMLI